VNKKKDCGNIELQMTVLSFKFYMSISPIHKSFKFYVYHFVLLVVNDNDECGVLKYEKTMKNMRQHAAY